MSTNTSNSLEVEHKSIPFSLIPIDRKDVTTEWAEENYRHYHKLNKEITSTAWGTREDVRTFMQSTLNFQEKIKEDGVQGAKKEVVRIVNEELELKTEDGQPPTSLEDVVKIVTNKPWYQDKQGRKQEMVYMCTHRLFRNHYNGWAKDIENRSMKDLDLKYHREEGSTRTPKGCYYQLLVKRASNTIAGRIQRAMDLSHGEHIASRKKDNSNYTYKMAKFGCFQAWIAKRCRSPLISLEMEGQNIMNSKEEMKRKLQEEIKKGRTTVDEVTSWMVEIETGKYKRRH